LPLPRTAPPHPAIAVLPPTIPLLAAEYLDALAPGRVLLALRVRQDVERTPLDLQ
jgi:hypothetical protein